MNQFVANACAALTYDQLIRLQYDMCMFNMTAFEQCVLLTMLIQKLF